MLGSHSIGPVLEMFAVSLYEVPAFTSCILEETISGNLWVHVLLLVKNSVGPVLHSGKCLMKLKSSDVFRN